MARVELLSREGCHLCDDARAVVAAVCGSAGFDEVDVDSDPALTQEFGWDVPVVRVDGRTLSVHRVEAARLAAALSAAPGTWRPW